MDHLSIYEVVGVAVILLTSSFGGAMLLTMAFRGTKEYIKDLFHEHDEDVLTKIGRR